MKFDVRVNVKDAMRGLEGLRKDILDRAAISAVNKAAAMAKTAMSKEIRAEFVLPAAKVNQSLRIKRARIVRGVAYIEAALESPSQKRRSLNIINFKANQTKAGVTFRIKQNSGRKLLKGAFIGNKGRTVFQRVDGTTMATRSKYANTKHAQKIKAVQTIDVAQMFNTKRINAKVVRSINDNLPRLMQNEARFFVNKFNNTQSKGK